MLARGATGPLLGGADSQGLPVLLGGRSGHLRPTSADLRSTSADLRLSVSTGLRLPSGIRLPARLSVISGLRVVIVVSIRAERRRASRHVPYCILVGEAPMAGKTRKSKKPLNPRRTPLSAIVERFLRDLLDNGNLKPTDEKARVMWVVMNREGEILHIRSLRRLAQNIACTGDTIHRVRLFFEGK